MTSGWADEPEVAVETEEIKPSVRERLANWWARFCASTEPRSGLDVVGTGFTSYMNRAGRKSKSPAGRHRADKTLF